jgi:AraC family transcriptional regulator
MSLSDGMVDAALRATGFSMEVRSFPKIESFDRTYHKERHSLTCHFTTGRSAVRSRFDRRDNPDSQWIDVGSLMFVPAEFPMHYQAEKLREKRIGICAFDRDCFEQITDLKPSWQTDQLISYLNIRNFSIRDIMRRLGAEALAPGYGSLLLCEGLGQMLIVELARHFNGLGALERRSVPFDREAIRRIEEYVRATCGDGSTPTVADLASLCNVSVRHLRQNFKSSTGQTLYQFIEDVRLNQSATLLSDTDLPLKIIAWRTGFATPSRFTASFKLRRGMTPKAFRSAVRRG